MSEDLEIFYSYDPEQVDTPALKEGVTAGWLVQHDGVGPGRAVRVVAATDAEGVGFIEQVGEWQDVTITDD